MSAEALTVGDLPRAMLLVYEGNYGSEKTEHLRACAHVTLDEHCTGDLEICLRCVTTESVAFGEALPELQSFCSAAGKKRSARRFVGVSKRLYHAHAHHTVCVVCARIHLRAKKKIEKEVHP